MKRSLVILLTAVSISAMTAGTAFPAFAEATEAEAEETTDGAENAADSELEDGVYGVEFDTDSSMFHVNEACNGRATLTVKDGKMTVHITLVSKNIENVFLGTAEDAQKIQKKQVCYASHEHEEFVVHIEKTIHLISLLFFYLYLFVLVIDLF